MTAETVLNNSASWFPTGVVKFVCVLTNKACLKIREQSSATGGQAIMAHTFYLITQGTDMSLLVQNHPGLCEIDPV